MKCLPFFALAATVFIESALILFLESIVEGMLQKMVENALEDDVMTFQGLPAPLEMLCLAVLASYVMANEIMPAVHFLLWIWGAAGKDTRFQPETPDDKAKDEQICHMATEVRPV